MNENQFANFKRLIRIIMMGSPIKVTIDCALFFEILISFEFFGIRKEKRFELELEYMYTITK